ncbi:hypothetical protein PsorP6_009711 [Peronosclerospora sorghi]|uniref:Uncharacterized protein n=1 Tax=Peronosclerospora sorghi TaxID=230839 RepID=A0ACC0VYW1_9STRA|nr:hypothetical protein PsorP6_009711 [Peronosclerospora sorghi]
MSHTIDLADHNNMARVSDAENEDDVDEQALRRRLQYKHHQRRHRARQKEKLAALDLEVQALAAEIQTLHRHRQKLLVETNVFASRGTHAGVPVQVATEYFRLFQIGTSCPIDQQEDFLRAVMTSITKGPDYMGVDTIVTQWRRYYHLFAYTRYKTLSMKVTTVHTLTVVEVDSIFSIRATREGILALYPSLTGDLELTQKLSSATLDIHGKYRFIFDSSGLVTWFSAEWDLVEALHRSLGSLLDVSTVLSGANISSSTGQIRLEHLPGLETKPRVDPRHQLDFLLS